MKRRMFILFGLVLCLLLTSCNTVPEETSATTTGGGVTTSTTTTPEKTTTAPVIDYTDHNIYIFKVALLSLAEFYTYREMTRFEDPEASEYYLYTRVAAGCTDVRPERFSAFVELVESLPLLPLLGDGEVIQISYAHQINRSSKDDPGKEVEGVSYVISTPNEDGLEINFLLYIDDVAGTIAAVDREHALEQPIRSADGRVTLYTQWSRPHQSKPGTYVTGLMEIDGIYVTYRLYVSPESDVNLISQLPLLSLTDLVEKAE